MAVSHLLFDPFPSHLLCTPASSFFLTPLLSVHGIMSKSDHIRPEDIEQERYVGLFLATQNSIRFKLTESLKEGEGATSKPCVTTKHSESCMR